MIDGKWYDRGWVVEMRMGPLYARAWDLVSIAKGKDSGKGWQWHVGLAWPEQEELLSGTESTRRAGLRSCRHAVNALLVAYVAGMDREKAAHEAALKEVEG